VTLNFRFGHEHKAENDYLLRNFRTTIV